jgi:hypothetical protein
LYSDVKDDEARLGFLQTRESIGRYGKQIARLMWFMMRLSDNALFRSYMTIQMQDALESLEEDLECAGFSKKAPPESQSDAEMLLPLLRALFYRDFPVVAPTELRLSERDVVALFVRCDGVCTNGSLKSPLTLSRSIPPLMMAGRYAIMMDLMLDPTLVKSFYDNEE